MVKDIVLRTLSHTQAHKQTYIETHAQMYTIANITHSYTITLVLNHTHQRTQKRKHSYTNTRTTRLHAIKNTRFQVQK